jgi:hypothetical protein
MASGYLDLAYLIEISVVFNLAYREIKHGTVLEKMKKIREKMFRDEELQERIKKIKKDSSLGSDTVASSYEKLIAIISVEYDDNKSEDCKKIDSKLCKAWDHNKRYCKYFVNIILTGKGLVRVNFSIGITLVILLFATIFPHINMNFNIFIWWILFVTLVITILIPIYLLYMSEKVGNILIGKNGQKGLIEKLEGAFNTSYNQYLVEESGKEFI